MLVFNVIYTGGTVRYLHGLVDSLALRSPFHFRLVSNGCSQSERALLERKCRDNDRFTFLALPGDRTMRHGDALTWLHRRESSRYFCFADSDVVATADFERPVLDAVATGASAVFAARHLCLDGQNTELPERARHVSAAYTHTKREYSLGSSHFAVYHNGGLCSLLDDFQLTFEVCKRSRLRENVLTELGRVDGIRHWYDTGKVINLLLQARGEKTIDVNLPGIEHIGGLSAAITRRVSNPKCGSASLAIGRMFQVAQLAFRRILMREGPGLLQALQMATIHYKKDRLADWYAARLYSKVEKQPLPSPQGLSSREMLLDRFLRELDWPTYEESG